MNTDNINQALAQIETSLKELDSARKQVEKVTESSSKLTSATSSLVQEVKLIADKIGNETSAIIANFSEKLSAFDKKLIFNSDASQKSFLAEVEKFRKSTIELKTSTENAISEIKSLSSNSIKANESEISKKVDSVLTHCTKEVIEVTDKMGKETSTLLADFSEKLSVIDKKFHNTTDAVQKNVIAEVEKFRESSTDLTTTSENAINEIKSFSIGAIKEQESEISKTINSISSYCIQVQGLIEKLSELEFNNQLNKLDANISSIHTSIQKVQGQIENAELNIADNLVKSSEKHATSLTNFQEYLNQSVAALVLEMKVSAKKQQTNTYITWVIIALGFLSIIIVSKYRYLSTIFQ